MRNSILTLALVGAAIMGGLVGGNIERANSETRMSELATAQLLTTDKNVRWVGFVCGDDGAVIFTENMPGSDCVEMRRLNDRDILES